MNGGWFGRYLRIDLTARRAEEVPLSPDVLAAFVGGVGLGTWICLAEGGARHDPFAPEAPLVFALSPLVGTPLTTSAKFAVVGRSPLTGLLSDAISSSHFAIAAKRAGYDAIVITGASDVLCRVTIDDRTVRFEDVPHLAGAAASECGLPGYRTAATGPAGEQLVRFACISNDGRHAGRGGLGALMGAKQLKALSVRGTGRVPLASQSAVVAAARTLSERSMGPATAKYRELGTVANVLALNRLSALPTRNFQAGQFTGAPQISGEALHESASGRGSCAACTIGCEHFFRSRDGSGVRMEYETVFALGSLLGIEDREAVIAAAQRCDALGLDTISTGGTLAFAMEAGVGGLQFGDADAALRMLDHIGTREGAGDLLAEGSRRAAATLGCPELAMHVKGLEMPGYDPRTMQAMALGLAVSTRGADHNRSGAYELDISAEGDRLNLDTTHIGQIIAIENRQAAMDSLILCKFLRGVFTDFSREGAELLALVTGRQIDLDAVGVRVCNLRKRFNEQAGWTRADDTLPPRMLTGTMTRQRLDGLIDHYYRERRWDAAGRINAAQRQDIPGLTLPNTPA